MTYPTWYCFQFESQYINFDQYGVSLVCECITLHSFIVFAPIWECLLRAVYVMKCLPTIHGARKKQRKKRSLHNSLYKNVLRLYWFHFATVFSCQITAYGNLLRLICDVIIIIFDNIFPFVGPERNNLSFVFWDGIWRLNFSQDGLEFSLLLTQSI